MAGLIEEKAKELLSIMADRQTELTKKEGELDKKSPEAQKESWEVAKDYLNILSYPLSVYELYHAHQFPLPDALFTSIRSLWVTFLSYGEIAVSPHLDIPFSEIDEKLTTLGDISLEERLLFLQKCGFLLNYAVTFSDMHSKMKFVWIDLMARLAVIMKNAVRYVDVYPALALDHPEHEEYSSIIYLVTHALSQSAESLRKRYELKGQTGDDLDKALVYLSVLKQTLIVTANSAEMDNVQKKHDVWQAKLQADKQRAKQS